MFEPISIVKRFIIKLAAFVLLPGLCVAQSSDPTSSHLAPPAHAGPNFKHKLSYSRDVSEFLVPGAYADIFLKITDSSRGQGCSNLASGRILTVSEPDQGEPIQITWVLPVESVDKIMAVYSMGDLVVCPKGGGVDERCFCKKIEQMQKKLEPSRAVLIDGEQEYDFSNRDSRGSSSK